MMETLYKQGDRVQVIQIIDEEGDEKYIGKIGTIVALDYDCGCGQTYPHDPMIMVEFDNGKSEEFWKEELVIITTN